MLIGNQFSCVSCWEDTLKENYDFVFNLQSTFHMFMLVKFDVSFFFFTIFESIQFYL